jgi:iron complex outermembrane receptor protein
MYMRFHKFSLLASVAMTLAGAGVPALATEADGITDNDIVVTARRVEERLQDVPISMTVFTQQAITDRNIVSGKDLTTYTPSLSSNSQFGNDNSTFSLRGFVQDLFTSPSVGVYFADVIAPRGAGTLQAGDGAGPGSFFDLQNVQVLKGPQGTLFGRNTTGGAILLVPQKPTGRFEGYVEGSVGNYDMRRLQAVVNVPLSDTARLRVGVDRMTRDGYLNNISGVGSPDMGDTDYVAARASFVADLTPNLENYTILSYSRSNTNGQSTKITSCDPDKLIGRAGSGLGLTAQGIRPNGIDFIPVGYMCQQQMAREAATGNFYTVSNSMPNAGSVMDQWQIINTTTWKVSDNLTVKNIVSYAELYNELRVAPFGNYYIIPSQAELDAAGVAVTTPAGFVGQGIGFQNIGQKANGALNHQSTFTEELQFQGVMLDDRLNWQAGAYLELAEPLDFYVGNANSSFAICPDLPNVQCSPPYGVLSNLNTEQRRIRYRDLGLYVQASYNITEKLKFTGGIRYTDDLSQAVSQGFTSRFLSNGLRISTGCANTDTTLAQDCILNLRQRSSAPTWLVNFDYKPTDDILLYAKWSRGYRQGSVNARGLSPNNKFGEEKVEAYEVGAKTSWRGAVPGYLNIAGFYNDFSDQQIIVSIINSNSTTNSLVCNCATSRIYGLELDGSISPVEGLQLSGAFAYLNTKITGFTPPPMPSPSAAGGDGVTPWRVITAPSVGSRLTLTPRYKATGTAAYTLPLPESVGSVTASATVTYTSSYLSQYASRAGIDAITLLNLNLNWTNVAGGPVDLGLFATNVTKQKYYTYQNDLYNDVGFTSATVGEPRMYGLRLKYRFGASAY